MSNFRLNRFTDQLHTATTPARFNNRCWRDSWPIWCPWNGPTDVYRSHNLLYVLVRSKCPRRRVCNMIINILYRSFVCPIFGAYVADTYLGRYKTICVSVAIVLVGHIIMIFSAIPGIIGSDTSLVLFIISVVVTGFGTGGFKSSIGPLIAEQYRRTKRFIRIRKSGERVIVDPGLTTSRIYMVNCRLPPDISDQFQYLVLFSFCQHRCTSRTGWNGLRGKGLVTLCPKTTSMMVSLCGRSMSDFG